MNRKVAYSFVSLIVIVLTVSSVVTGAESAPSEKARRILHTCGASGGLVVHIGCGDGTLTAALRASDAYMVHGLDTDATNVDTAREHVKAQGCYGTVCIDRLRGEQLPYIDNLVNLVVCDNLGDVSMKEVMRVLCSKGVAYVKQRGKWVKTVKPRPREIDDWTHYLYDASNNAVSHDTVVGPLGRIQWVGSPRYGRHHDRMSSVSAAVSAGGRVFYIIDEASPASILIPPKWSLVCRDAFNGTILWKRAIGKWHTHLWPLKSGPAQLPRRLVAVGDRVYVTLALNAPVTVLDGATGKTVLTYAGTMGAEEMVLSDGTLYALVNRNAKEPAFADQEEIKHAYGGGFWDEKPRHIVAVRAADGERLWESKRCVLPATLAAANGKAYFHDGQGVVCLDGKTSDELWRSSPIDRAEVIKSFYLPTLLVHKDVVLFSGGETAGGQTGSWYESGKDNLTAVSAETGDVLWKEYHPPSGYRSPEDTLVVNDMVWTGETTSGRAVGVFKARDLHSGKVLREFPPDVQTYWFHHRCYRGKATDKYLLMSRTGTEFIDVESQQWTPHHWARGACLYGVMPANGLMYNPPHPCACYLESKMYGFNALAPKSTENAPKPVRLERRLEKGPAYGESIGLITTSNDWSTYRGDQARSGRTRIPIATALEPAWQTRIGRRLTSPVIAGGRLFVASVDGHTVHAVDAESGRQFWRYTAGGRVDSAPTIYRGRVLFGSADGWVYCLRASDGELVWRFLAATCDRRLSAFEQLESVWPVHGSVLVKDDVLYCVAGRSMFVDGGLRLWRLDPKTGKALSETVLDDRDPATGKKIEDYVSWLNMPVAMPDILSSDGRLVYMRSQAFEADGTRFPLEKMTAGKDADRGAPPATQRAEHAHLFSPTGFLDDSYWHRTYWMYGSKFVSGWCGYFLAGKMAPAGRILVLDDSTVYGFGRKPQYYRWTTPIEHQLFAASKLSTEDSAPDDSKVSRVYVEKSRSLNPGNKPLTVEAWVKSGKQSGVVLARGGNSLGYVLYLQGGRPRFALRVGGQLSSVVAEQNLTGRWAHIAGVLTSGKMLQIYVDGELAASKEVASLPTDDPAEAMQIGADEGSIVGDYGGELPFTGLIDEVRVYRRALSQSQIEDHAQADRQSDAQANGLVLYCSFDKGIASDESGNNNKMQVEGFAATKGKIGQAMRFTGKGKGASDFKVNHEWTQDVSIIARAMLLAGKTLFVAGPPDLIDEQQVFSRIDDPDVIPALTAQASSLAGKQGAVLLAVSAASGNELARYELDSPPVFDGMAAAGGRLYMSTVDGRVISFREAR